MAATLEKLLLHATESSVTDIPIPSELEMYSQDVNLSKLKVRSRWYQTSSMHSMQPILIAR